MLPERALLKRKDILGYYGISKEAFYGLVKHKALKPVILPGRHYAYYARVDVERVFGKCLKGGQI